MIDESIPVMDAPAEQAPIDADAEVERAAELEAELAVPKHRIGGPHSDILPGEVGPCTRCGWVWTPSAATLRRRSSGLPLRCANCRTDGWKDAPIMERARRPGDPEWALRRDTIANRKKRRKVAKLKELASELNVELVNDPPEAARLPAHRPVAVSTELPPLALDMTPRLPWQSSKPRAVIPPPPGMVAEEDKR